MTTTIIDRAAMLCLGLLLSVFANAQAPESFTVATLNVDGLPKKLLVVNVNPDGPGSAGSARIGKYLTQKGYDLVMLQEDFNYNEELTVLLEDDKILCINPVGGGQLRPVTYSRDKEGYLHDGKPLGDHYPVSVTFEVQGTKGNTAIEELSAPDMQSSTYYDLQGRHVGQPAKGVYIYKGKKVVK